MNGTRKRRRALIEALEDLREIEPLAAGGAASLGRGRFLSLAAALRQERGSAPPRGVAALLRGAWPSPARLWRVAITAATVLALLWGGTSVGVAAQARLPGDPLYPLKTGLEEGRALVTIAPPSRVRLGCNLADRRVTELEALVQAERWDAVPIATQGLARWAELVGVNLERSRARGDAEASALAEMAWQRSLGWSAALDRAASRVPAALHPALAATSALVGEVAQVAAEIGPVEVGVMHTPTPTGTATVTPTSPVTPAAPGGSVASPRRDPTSVPPGLTRTPPGLDVRVTPPGLERGEGTKLPPGLTKPKKTK